MKIISTPTTTTTTTQVQVLIVVYLVIKTLLEFTQVSLGFLVFDKKVTLTSEKSTNGHNIFYNFTNRSRGFLQILAKFSIPKI